MKFLIFIILSLFFGESISPDRNNITNFKVFKLNSNILNEKLSPFMEKVLCENQSSNDIQNLLEIYNITKEDFDKMTYTVEQEAHDLDYCHKALIARVIINRAKSKIFKEKTISEVLQAKNQFSGFINYKTKKHKPNTDTVNACLEVIKGKFSDYKILFFYNSKITGKIAFFEKRKFVLEKDGHRFFE